ncbi:hypothetical protein PV433_26025 [Paenibacillus sp. GYB004]|uniref:hypothetical protein n=1 Tax=Paenibacillus sp. GYB004 TaxID=2994393 RepID=UPI002F96396C
MPVQITINGADAAESLRELSALAVGLTGAPAITPAPVKETEAPKQTRRTKKEEPAVEKNDPVEEEPAAQPAADDADDGDDGGEPIPTDVELRAKAQEVGKKAGKEKVKALLDEYESSNITGIPENKRAAFMRDLEALL